MNEKSDFFKIFREARSTKILKRENILNCLKNEQDQIKVRELPIFPFLKQIRSSFAQKCCMEIKNFNSNSAGSGAS